MSYRYNVNKRIQELNAIPHKTDAQMQAETVQKLKAMHLNGGCKYSHLLTDEGRADEMAKRAEITARCEADPRDSSLFYKRQDWAITDKFVSLLAESLAEVEAAA